MIEIDDWSAPCHCCKLAQAANRIAKIQPDAFLLEQVPDIVKHKKFFGNVLAK